MRVNEGEKRERVLLSSEQGWYASLLFCCRVVNRQGVEGREGQLWVWRKGEYPQPGKA